MLGLVFLSEYCTSHVEKKCRILNPTPRSQIEIIGNVSSEMACADTDSCAHHAGNLNFLLTLHQGEVLCHYFFADF